MYKAMCLNHKRLQTYLPCAPLSLSTSVLVRLVLDLLLHFLPELRICWFSLARRPVQGGIHSQPNFKMRIVKLDMDKSCT